MMSAVRAWAEYHAPSGCGSPSCESFRVSRSKRANEILRKASAYAGGLLQ